MERERKPEIWKGLRIIKYVLIALLLLGAALLFISGVKSASRYRPVMSRGVEVTGTITKITESIDSEGVDEYDVYVSYDYQGQSYTVHYDTYRSLGKAGSVGDQRTFKINPDNPGETMDSLWSSVLDGMFGGVLLLACAGAATGIPERFGYVESFGMSAENIRKDLVRKNKSRRLAVWLLTMGIGFLAVWAVYQDVFTLFPVVVSAVFLILGVWQLVKVLLERSRIQNGKYRIQQKQLVDKHIESDSESDTYYLVYGSGEETFRTNVTSEEYEKAKTGDSVVVVCFEGSKVPIFNYRQLDSGWICRQNATHF